MCVSFLLPFSINEVKGHSMQPNLNEGNKVVVFRWAYGLSRPLIGDVIVFSGNDSKEYVKRIVAVANKNEFIVQGDNKSDSKKLPPVSRKAIIGKVVATY